MKKLHQITVGLICAGILGTNWAATVVERRDTRGEKQKVIIDEQQARIISPDPDYYMLINLKEKQAYQVDVKEKRMIKMNIIGKPPQLPPDMPPPPRARQVQAELVKKGEGPKIAGYSTINYQVKANGKVCSENYFSSAATEIAHLKEFLDAMYHMSNSRKIKGMPVHPCQQAHDEQEAESMKLGIPMKSVIKGGRQGDKVRYEITHIETDVKVSPETFTLPQGYEVVTEEEMMEQGRQEMMKQMEEARQHEDDPYSRGEPPPRNWRERDGQREEYYMPPPMPPR